MCTVTIIPLLVPRPGPGRMLSDAGEIGGASGFRLVTNRDELRTRPLARPPQWTQAAPSAGAARPAQRSNADAARVIYPVDPAGGGTWVAAASSGLVLCLLNANSIPPTEVPPSSRLVSRGVIIPRLLSLIGPSRRLAEVRELLGSFELGRFAPFRLIAVCPLEGDDDRGRGFAAFEASWDRASLNFDEPAPGPACYVSSGLGDPVVRPRITLFNELVRASHIPPRDLPAAQDRFHHHTWPDRPEISVLMSRRDARTVSISTVEVQRSAAEAFSVDMRYEAVPVGVAPLVVGDPDQIDAAASAAATSRPLSRKKH